VSSTGEVASIVVIVSGPIEMGTVDALARLLLDVRRLGGDVRLHAAPDELEELIGLAGLEEVLCDEDALGDGLGETEEREKSFGVEEEADP
jgi:hypothetical protein